MSFLDIFTISPLQRPREISQNVSGPDYVRRGAGYKIHICAKLYYLGRAKVFSSVATDFGSWTISETGTRYAIYGTWTVALLILVRITISYLNKVVFIVNFLSNSKKNIGDPRTTYCSDVHST